MQLEARLACSFDGAESNFAIPVASLHYLLATFHDSHWELKLLDASVDLVNRVFPFPVVESLLFVASERERSRWVQVVGSWKPNKLLSKAFFCGSDNFLVFNELCLKNCFIGDHWRLGRGFGG